MTNNTCSRCRRNNSANCCRPTDNCRSCDRCPAPDPETFFVLYLPNRGIGGSVDEDLRFALRYTIKTPEEANVSRPGCTFAGWNTCPCGGGTFFFPGQVIIITENFRLFAIWRCNPPVETFSVTYNANGGFGGSTDSGIIAGSSYVVKTPFDANVSRPGFDFIAWNTAPDGSGTAYVPGDIITLTSDLVLYALWDMPVITANVVYDPNGGFGGSTDPGIIVGSNYVVKTPFDANVFRPGFDFIAWNTAPDGSGTVYVPGDIITVTSDLVLYALWDMPVITANVVYDPNGGFGGFFDTDLIIGSTYTIRSAAQANVTRLGYDFIAWSTTPDGTGTIYVPGDNITITGDLTLYALWAPIQTWIISYLPNGGVGSTYSDTVTNGSSYTIKPAVVVGISRPGYVFAGWNTSPDGSGISYSPGAVIVVTSNLSLYAIWLMPNFTVTYDPNGGAGSVYSDETLQRTSYIVKSEQVLGFSRAGFIFTGWNTRADGSGSNIAPGTSITVTRSFTLYAQWDGLA